MTPNLNALSSSNFAPAARTAEQAPLPGTRLGALATQFYADLVVRGQQEGGLRGALQQALGWTGGLVAALWTPETAPQTAQVLEQVADLVRTSGSIGRAVDALNFTEAFADALGNASSPPPPEPR